MRKLGQKWNHDPLVSRECHTYVQYEEKARPSLLCFVLSRPGAEPPAVRSLLEKLRPLCHGLSVCGAGGGGFVACITKSPGDKARRMEECKKTRSKSVLSLSTSYRAVITVLMATHVVV